MSGMKNLAAAIATDPSFASQTKGLMTREEAAKYVPVGKDAGNGKMPKMSKK